MFSILGFFRTRLTSLFEDKEKKQMEFERNLNMELAECDRQVRLLKATRGRVTVDDLEKIYYPERTK